jgi:hypothetical protein
VKICKKSLHEYNENLKQCPLCQKEYNKKYLLTPKNKEHVKEYNKEYQKKYYLNAKNKEYAKECHKEYNKKYLLTPKNKERKKERIEAYQKANPDKMNAKAAKRRAAKLNATPKWLSKEQLDEITEFYTLAQELAWLNQDGKCFHVDHIIPLQGKNVCGLHVPWNLQLLSERENLIKSNK